MSTGNASPLPPETAAVGPAPVQEQLPTNVQEGVQKIEAVLEQIPQPMRRFALEAVITETRIESHRGPLPQPEVLRGYGEVLPGLPDRIVTMVESQSSHRLEQESKLVNARIRQTDRAQMMAFALVLVILIVVAVLGASGERWLAGVLATTTIASVVGAFLLRTSTPGPKKPKSPEGADEADQLTAPSRSPKPSKRTKRTG